MKILQVVEKIPGGLMIISLLPGTIINTFLGNVLWSAFDDTFTTYLWKSGVMPILAVFISCNATTINFRKADVTVYKGMSITTVKVGVGIIIGLTCGTLSGEKGFLGLSTLAIVGTLADSNGGPYVALAGEYGDTVDVGTVSTLSINSGPFLTMVILGAAGVAEIPMSILIGRIVPVVVGCMLDNLDEDIHRFCESGATMLIPLSAFPLRVGLNIMNLLRVGGPGILLGVARTLIIDLADYPVYKLLCMDRPEVGGVIGTTVGNTAATPASVAAVDATLLMMAKAVTAQITVAIIVATILCLVLVSYLHKIEMCKRGR